MNTKLAELRNRLEGNNFQKLSALIKRLENNEHIKVALLDDEQVSEGLKYHLERNQSVFSPVFRPASFSYFAFMREVASLYKAGSLYLDDEDERLITPDIGSFAEYEGHYVPLDFPMEVEHEDDFRKMAAEYNGREVPIGKPMKNSGGGKKWVVYVKNPSTGRVKKITYGDGGMKANWNDPKARASFAARHQCEKKKDRTKAGYWACRAHKDFGKNVSGRYW